MDDDFQRIHRYMLERAVSVTQDEARDALARIALMHGYCMCRTNGPRACEGQPCPRDTDNLSSAKRTGGRGE